MSTIRTVAPPTLPIPPTDYSVGFQNLLNTSIQQYGSRTSNAVNQLLTNTAPQPAQFSTILNVSSGSNATYRINMSGTPVEITPPTGGIDGDVVTMWLYAGSADSRVVTLNPDIVVPSTITGATPITVAIGKKAVYTIRYDGVLNGGQWELVSFQNGY